MIRRIWNWLKSLFGARDTTGSVPVADVREYLMPGSVDAVKSANICLVNWGATKRERRYARGYLRRVGSITG